eukprot:CAMPEP_0181485086 /NCGR_PEP_ID=MMETSP1110-20121109/46364_1 /TAXON_ID=174948 /ORGANISM="Symbiodinium sp., Strain CCMP421" /LENGTH=296 /DNA_ID=CAMNT_0023611035 /DNA_START=1 /DNA_END=887 /DNA_ORIENTATION=+
MAPISPIPEDEAGTELVNTILFVDVDGVLNVGIYDRCDAPILLKSSELALAKEICAMGWKGTDGMTALKICSLAATQADQSGTTFEALASQDQLSKVLVRRLAELIEDAGPGCHVVLSSSWRKQQHLKRRRTLEESIGESLGRDFSFDDATEMRPEVHPGDRMQAIREYLRTFAKTEEHRLAEEVKVIVIDDFFLSPLSAFSPFVCGVTRVCSTWEAEGYLQEQLEKLGILASVKILHCYAEFTTKNGLILQVGTGLSSDLLKEAKLFLEQPVECDCDSPESMQMKRSITREQNAG